MGQVGASLQQRAKLSDAMAVKPTTTNRVDQDGVCVLTA